MDIRLNFDTSRTVKRLADRMGGKVQFAFDNQVMKDSNYFCPMDTGNLISSGIRGSNPGSGKVIWDAPYAKAQYYGVDYNFSKDANPNATSKWFEEAKKRYKKDWLSIVQRTFA